MMYMEKDEESREKQRKKGRRKGQDRTRQDWTGVLQRVIDGKGKRYRKNETDDGREKCVKW